MKKIRKVAVLMGGTSSEREVSLRSGAAVMEALKTIPDITVEGVVLDEDNLNALPKGIDAVFIALHGGYGENGGVQDDLDKLRIPYTGPGAAASRIAMDKVETKKRLEEAGIRTAPWELLSRKDKTTSLPLPVVVKPPSDGSSVGISKVSGDDEWEAALNKARDTDCDGNVLVEAYIPGREMTVSVLDDGALPAIEIKARNGWYGYAEKYTAGMTDYIFPDAETENGLLETLRKTAEHAFKVLGLRNVGRVDFRVSPDGVAYVLEVNTIPGCTATSLLPKAAAKAGMSFPELCAKLLLNAKWGA